jgi:septum site-determining protein MinC
MAFVLTPEVPIASWLAELDNLLGRSAGFFAGRPVVIDLAGVNFERHDLTQLIAELNARDIGILAIEGGNPSLRELDLPPRLDRIVHGIEKIGPQPDPDPPPEQSAPSSLLIEEPVRSGQSVVFPTGDVTVVASVASGADVIAGGSIHIYGALRGRAMAGTNGKAGARIFCRKNEAELLAIDGAYRTADEMADKLRNQAIQARLEHGTLAITLLE